MANNDSRRVPQITYDKAAPPKDGVPSKQSLNDAIRQLYEMVYSQEGRTGTTSKRATLEVVAQAEQVLKLKSFTYTAGSWEAGFTGSNGNDVYLAKGATFSLGPAGEEQWNATSTEAFVIRIVATTLSLYTKTGLTPPQPFTLGTASLTFDGTTLTLSGSTNIGGDVTFSGNITATNSLNVGAWEKTSSTAGTGDYDWDTTIHAGNFTLDGANEVFTCTLAGTYLITGVIGATVTAGSQGAVDLLINGTAIQRSQCWNESASNRVFGMPLTYTIHLVATDTVEIAAISGITTRFGSAAHPTTLTMVRLG